MLQTGPDPEIRKIARLAIARLDKPEPCQVRIDMSGAFAADFAQVNESIGGQLLHSGFKLIRSDKTFGPYSIEYRRVQGRDAREDYVILYKDMHYRPPQFHEPYSLVGYDEKGWVSAQVYMGVI